MPRRNRSSTISAKEIELLNKKSLHKQYLCSANFPGQVSEIGQK